MYQIVKKDIIKDLGHKYHLIAPDYPGFGNSSMPSIDEFEYSFDHLADIIEQFIVAKNIKKYSLYIMDYGSPVGFRIATRNPEKVQTLLIQNGNAYLEGLSPFALYYSYRTNIDQYPEWQAYLRKYQPPTLIIWEKMM